MELTKELNQSQLKQGVAPDGGRIGQYQERKISKNPRYLGSHGRWSAYAIRKNAQNSAPGLGNVDLILHGSFRDMFRAFLSGIIIFIESADSKMAKLIDQYNYNGEKIFGLTAKNKTIRNAAVKKSLFNDLHDGLSRQSN